MKTPANRKPCAEAGLEASQASQGNPYERRMAQFCRSAVQRSLLVGSLSSLGLSSVGCDLGAMRSGAAPKTDAPKPTFSGPLLQGDAPSIRSADEAASRPLLRGDAPRIRSTDGAASRPLLRGDAPSIRSTAKAAAFPCAPELSAAEQAAALAQSASVDHTATRAEWSRELAFRARGLSLTSDVDSIKISRVQRAGQLRDEDAGLSIQLTPLAVAGVPCSGVSDKQACEQALTQQEEALFALSTCQGQACPEFDFVYALTTWGNEVRSYSGPSELRQLFGAIDTPVEASIMLAAHKLSYGYYTCGYSVNNTHRITPAGYELAIRVHTSQCRPLTEKLLTYGVTADGQVKLLHELVLNDNPEGCVVSGRRPEGLLIERGQLNVDSDAGSLFARMAHLEHASVFAFEILHDELAALGAETPLLTRVMRARDDEVRHVRSMGDLARRFGAEPIAARVEKRPSRVALDIALENAREGCVRELYGALLAAFQAERATDPSVRNALSDIAQDEARHAALAWELADWLDAKLSPLERECVRAAREQALTELAAELTQPSLAKRTLCGLPALHQAQSLLSEMRDFVRAAEGALS